MGLLSLGTGFLTGIPAILTGRAARTRLGEEPTWSAAVEKVRTGLFLGSLMTGLSLIAFPLSPLVFRGLEDRQVSKNLARGLELNSLLDDYAIDHDGYPPDLATLATERPESTRLLYHRMWGRGELNWIYFDRVDYESSETELLLAAPEPVGFGENEERLVVRADGSSERLRESTFRQLAEQARHRDPPSLQVVEVTTAKFEHTALQAPVFEGFVRLDGLKREFDEIREVFFQGHAQQGLFLGSAIDRDALLAGDDPPLERTLSIASLKKFDRRSTTAKEFRRFRDRMRRGLGRKNFDQRMSNYGKRVTKDLQNHVDGRADVQFRTDSLPELLWEDEKSLAIAVVEGGSSREGRHTEQWTSSSVYSWLLVNEKIFVLCASASDSTESRAWTRHIMRDWQDRILAANSGQPATPPDQPEATPGSTVMLSVLRLFVPGILVTSSLGLLAFLGHLTVLRAGQAR